MRRKIAALLLAWMLVVSPAVAYVLNYTIADPTDPRLYVRWPMLYHGDTVVELWKPGNIATPLQGLLDMYDPKCTGAIKYTPDHIHQLN